MLSTSHEDSILRPPRCVVFERKIYIYAERNSPFNVLYHLHLSTRRRKLISTISIHSSSKDTSIKPLRIVDDVWGAIFCTSFTRCKFIFIRKHVSNVSPFHFRCKLEFCPYWKLEFVFQIRLLFLPLSIHQKLRGGIKTTA